MRSATRAALLAAALVGGSVACAQLLEPRTANQRALVQDVAKRMASCFTALGPKRAFPTVSSAPPQGELLAAVLMGASGPRVSDGYNYMLLVHGPSNSAFVVQLGGFAAARTVFGPLPLSTQCIESASQRASEASSSARHGAESFHEA